MPTVAVTYLARGYDSDHEARFRRFVQSYQTYKSGMDHKLYVIFKGFSDEAGRQSAEVVFADLRYEAIDTDDLSYDLGAYSDSLSSISEDIVLFFNTNSEIGSPYWLAKLIRNLIEPGVGIVGASGSYESLRHINPRFPDFPNPHLRTNAFALRRFHAVDLLRSYKITNKLDSFFAESGPDSLTQHILRLGFASLVVGGDGRGYPQQDWPASETSRQGQQGNLLVHDNYTRSYESLPPGERDIVSAAAWGRVIPATILE